MFETSLVNFAFSFSFFSLFILLSAFSIPSIKSFWVNKFKATGSFYRKNPGTDIAGKQMLANPVTENSKGLRLGSFDQIRGIIDEELEAIWTGNKNAIVAMNSAVSRGNALLRRFERANK